MIPHERRAEPRHATGFPVQVQGITFWDFHRLQSYYQTTPGTQRDPERPALGVPTPSAVVRGIEHLLTSLVAWACPQKVYSASQSITAWLLDISTRGIKIESQIAWTCHQPVILTVPAPAMGASCIPLLGRVCRVEAWKTHGYPIGIALQPLSRPDHDWLQAFLIHPHPAILAWRRSDQKARRSVIISGVLCPPQPPLE